MASARHDDVPQVLIVEDEWLIADMIARTVSEAGYGALGPVPTTAQAAALLADHRCDAALLDLNLGGTKGYALIDRLRGLGIPHLLVTGYSREDLPERYRSCAMLGKPLVPETLLAALRTLLSPSPAA